MCRPKLARSAWRSGTVCEELREAPAHAVNGLVRECARERLAAPVFVIRERILVRYIRHDRLREGHGASTDIALTDERAALNARGSIGFEDVLAVEASGLRAARLAEGPAIAKGNATLWAVHHHSCFLAR